MLGTFDQLGKMVKGAHELVLSGYYDSLPALQIPTRWPLTLGIERHPFFPIIAELKVASPSNSIISPHSVIKLVNDYVKGGAAALSVLTEPKLFGGSMHNIELVRWDNMPVLMKDFIVSERQIEAAARYGASAVLMIQGAYPGNEGKWRRDDLIELAHDLGLEVLLEGHTALDMFEAMNSEADILGVNQRDLRDLRVHHGHGVRVLPLIREDPRPIVVLSGLRCRDDLIDVRNAGADAVLIGTELSSCYDPMSRLHQLVIPR
ncbi:MAG: Indole-3-glycerol phosphate synthase [Methanomassiliicoccales archaeon PtaU1.Bin124]|nr:MAG: Indole-3-glycerol phosphate synthase [Methanomassiliicoccales archaeon PtaU1.Bin124]